MKGIFCVKHEKTIINLQHNKGEISATELLDVSPAISSYDYIRTLHDDKSGNLWIGTSSCLLKYNLYTENLERAIENTGRINGIISSAAGDVYLATESSGMFCLQANGATNNFPVNENCTKITVDPDNNVWVGTQQGNVYCYNPENGNLVSFAEKCGLNGDVILGIEAGLDGSIWIITDQKITIFNSSNQTFDIIRAADPAVRMNNFRCIFLDDAGTIYIGGTEGFLICPSGSLPQKTVACRYPLKLTAIHINNGVKMFDQDNKTITMNHSESDIELFFSTFDPLNAGKIRYAFRNRSGAGNWNYLPEGHNNIYLAQLPKGHNELEVMFTDENGYWNDQIYTVGIYRTPAWYETWQALLLYTAVILSLVFYFIRAYIKRQKYKNKKIMEEQVAQMKYLFFTNVSHELRTPLTLIITPLQGIINNITDAGTKKQLELINRSAQNLLGIVNQLLDFRKVEMGGESLSLTKSDMKELLKSVYDNFRLISSEKNIAFEFFCGPGPLWIYFDYDKVRKIVNNLLSNAFKFTIKGEVALTLDIEYKNERPYAVIGVEDTGCGIPENELKKIFDRFHQVKGQNASGGSGIGLHLVNEYAAMHGGEVSVASTLGKGTCFSVYIPADLDDKDFSDALPEEPAGEFETEDSGDGSGQKKILIVEDNPDFREYLKNELGRSYKVFEAKHGREGEKMVLENDPDIVVTDLMMPEMDGIELCHRIKNNIKISHIPVILLTASMDAENEKRGYKEGADAYISKPFDMDILLLRIGKLIEQQQHRRQSFKDETGVNPENVTISALDEKLMEKALALIEKNMGNAGYTVEEFSNDMAMSRANLFRKIRSITGMSPNEFVKSIRLKEAARLLSEGELPIVEIAGRVGFNTPGHFTKSFKRMFGVLPSQYVGK